MAKGILDSLPTSRYGFKGLQPPHTGLGNKNSTLHYTSSINGNPSSVRTPSNLDLNGVTPPRYLDNPPK